MHLLVLDDDERINAFIASVAERHGWSVEAVTFGAAFQALFDIRRPDAIFLDLQLGAGDGIEQLHFLRHQNFSGAVVLMSGFDARVLAVAQQVGNSLGIVIDTVIEKPARAARVAAVLEQIERNAQASTGGVAAVIAGKGENQPNADMISTREIARAIADNEMELHLQPVVSAIDGSVRRAEALIRWRHPVAGLIPPDRFVPIAEQDDATTDQLTRWVIGTAIVHGHKLAERGFEVQICVNVSGRNLRSLDFPDQLAALLKHRDALPGAIGLEITETVAMLDVEATKDILTRLRLKGFTLAIDDFGIGYSSLEALLRMPFSTVKIDKGFVTDLRNSRDSLTIVKSVIDLARNMGLTTVAEGVENEEVAALLIGLGVDALQGYHFSRPLPFEQFSAWLQARSDCRSRPKDQRESPSGSLPLRVF
jgi:EAL domain-containing protein (putative c-di-GMP-specific phosphodiesterase class I)/ActR/RegA family two-component response regulator